MNIYVKIGHLLCFDLAKINKNGCTLFHCFLQIQTAFLGISN